MQGPTTYRCVIAKTKRWCIQPVYLNRGAAKYWINFHFIRFLGTAYDASDTHFLAY